MCCAPAHPHLTMLWSGQLKSDFGPTLLGDSRIATEAKRPMAVPDARAAQPSVPPDKALPQPETTRR